MQIQAALLSVRLSPMTELNEERKQIAERYLENIHNDRLVLPKVRDNATSVWHQFVVRCETRDELAAYLKDRGIGTIIHYPVPPHLSKAYEYLNIPKGALPITEKYADTVLSIPCYNGLTTEEQDAVIQALNEY